MVTFIADALVDVGFNVGVLSFATRIQMVEASAIRLDTDEVTKYNVPPDFEVRCEGLYHTNRSLQTNSRHHTRRDQPYR